MSPFPYPQKMLLITKPLFLKKKKGLCDRLVRWYRAENVRAADDTWTYVGEGEIQG